MEPIFMNSENSKTNEYNRFIYQFTDKLNLKNPHNENIRLLNLSIYYTFGNINLHTTTINLKCLLQLRIMNLNCLMGHIGQIGLSQTFKTILSTY